MARDTHAALQWLATLLRVVLGGTLAVAGASKLSDPAESVRAVRAYELLPEAVVPAVGYALPPLELALAALLLVGLGTRWVALASAVLMALFVAGIASAWARGLTIDCGCFGGGGQVDADETAYLPEILRDTALVLVSLFLVWRPPGRFALDHALRIDDHVPADDAKEHA